MKKNDEIILNITDMTAEGSGVGKHGGMAVFVPLTALGDTVRVKVLKVKKSYAYGKAEETITPSSDRIEPDCPVFSRCGGCTYRHIKYAAECKIKSDRVYEAVKRIGGIDMQPQRIIADPNLTNRYRNKAQYPVSSEGSLGFYAFHSHRIIPCRNCLLQPEVFAVISEETEKWINTFNISVYSETAHSGLLRHVYIRIAEKTGEIMLTLVINGDNIPHIEALTSVLKNKLGNSLKSVQLNINKEKTNVILGRECRLIYGEPYITDILCGMKIRLSPLSFYQVNRAAAERLYEKAAEYAAPDGKKILDLYCGAGTIGLSMAKRAESVTGVEIVPEAIEDAKKNALINNIDNIRFICADAADAAARLSQENFSVDTVIVDPPRKGCSEELLNIIADKFAPKSVVYVSCDPATLARDIKSLTLLGYELTEYTPVDLFPRTAHVESVCLLSRKDMLQ